MHPRSKFLFRLAGHDRTKSASYYTPQSLTECLVKYALKELLKDKTADDILTLTVCEPAMGSAAFLNEVIDQLAAAYLERKQDELGDRIPHDRITLETQKVKISSPTATSTASTKTPSPWNSPKSPSGSTALIGIPQGTVPSKGTVP